MSKNLDELAGDLAYARRIAKRLAHLDPAHPESREQVALFLSVFRSLNWGEAFQEIDEHTEYEGAEDTLARIAAQNTPRYAGDHLDA